MERVPVFGAFDCPDAGQPMPMRSQSTTAIQALNLFNSPFVIARAERLAERLQPTASAGVGECVEAAYFAVLGRPPTDVERIASVRVAEQHGLASVCRVLMNSSEFVMLP
jgi:hypothetical protein